MPFCRAAFPLSRPALDYRAGVRPSPPPQIGSCPRILRDSAVALARGSSPRPSTCSSRRITDERSSMSQQHVFGQALEDG